MSATAPPTSSSPKMRMRITAASDLDVHDLLDHQGAAHDHDHADREHEPSGSVREERFHIRRIQQRHHEKQADGQKRDDPAGESPLRGQAAYQSAERRPLADPLDHAIEHPAELLPVSRCRDETSATCSTSRLFIRRATTASASSSGTPSCSSCTTRWNSLRDGSAASFTTSARPPTRL